MGRILRKPLRYEKHALMRMKQRGITESQVEAALREPHCRKPAERPGAVRCEHQMNGSERLVVVSEETDEFIRIVTTWVDRHVRN